MARGKAKTTTGANLGFGDESEDTDQQRGKEKKSTPTNSLYLDRHPGLDPESRT